MHSLDAIETHRPCLLVCARSARAAAARLEFREHVLRHLREIEARLPAPLIDRRLVVDPLGPGIRDCLADGMSEAEILAEYPQLTREDVLGAIGRSKERCHKPEKEP